MDVSAGGIAVERHYKLAELAKLWGLSLNTNFRQLQAGWGARLLQVRAGFRSSLISLVRVAGTLSIRSVPRALNVRPVPLIVGSKKSSHVEC